MNKKVLILVLLLLFLCFFTSGINPEQTQKKKSEKQLLHEVTVTLKLIQVYVTDKNGNPVKDLNKDDFILYDNGKLQAITDFEKHLLVRPEKKIVEEIAKTELPLSEDISARMNRKFFLFLDIDRNDTAGIGKSKKAALHFINTQLQPTDEVGVFSYSWIVGLVVHQYLTSNHEKARDAIKRIKEVPGIKQDGMGTSSGPRRGVALEGGSARGEAAASLGPGSTMSFLPPPTGQGGSLVAKTSNFINIIKELAKALRNIPGYKNIILFSRGIRSGLLFSRDQLLRENYEDMSKELATSNSPVYSVNTSPRDIPIYVRDPALKMLSELSGGKYFPYVDYYEKNAEQIQNVTSNYYVLGYYINEKWDGKYHKIKVEVKRKGCVVQSQGGYFNPKPFSKLSEFEKQLHIIDLALGKGHYYKAPYPFPVVALPCPIENKSGLILLSEIHMDNIEEVIGEKTEIVTLIFDKENNIVDSSQGKANLATIPQKLLHYYTVSSLEPGDYECRIVLRNLETGRSAVGGSVVTVPEVQPSGIFVYPPFILIPNTPCFYLKALKTEKEKKPNKTLSLNDIYPFLANNHSPLVCEIDGNVRKLLTVLKFCVKDVPDPELDISLQLVRLSTGEIIPLYFFLHDSWKVGTEDALLLEFHLPEMEPGQYELELFIKCYEPEMKATVKRGFRVR